MKLGKIRFILFVNLCISSFIASSSLASDATIKDHTAKAIKVVEMVNTTDTIKSEFTNDTITLPRSIPVGQVIYTEHKTNLNIILDYAFPIIMLMLGVLIDRIISKSTDNKRVKKEGVRWKFEIKSLLDPLKQQQETFKKFIKEYCDVKNRFDIPYINLQVLLKCEIFDSLNKEDLYRYLQLLYENDEVATHEYHKVIQVISSLKSCQYNLSDVISEMKTGSNKLTSQFEEVIREYNRKLTACLDVNLLPRTGATLQDIYNKTIIKQVPYLNIFELENSFVRPSIEILVGSKGDKQFRIELLHCLQSMLNIIMGLQIEKIYAKQNLEQVIDIYGKVANTIVSIKFDV